MSTVYIVGIIILAVMFSGGVGVWVYASIEPLMRPTISAPAAPSEYLLEAMREVDAMLPGTTPIAPPKDPPPKEPEEGYDGRFDAVMREMQSENARQCELANQQQNAKGQQILLAAQEMTSSWDAAFDRWNYTYRGLKHARYFPDRFGWVLEDGTFLDEMEHDADPRKAQGRALLAHLRSIGVPI